MKPTHKPPTTRFPYKGLYAIVDSNEHDSFGLKRLIDEIVQNSVIPVLQLRLKTMSMSQKIELIAHTIPLKKKRNFLFVVNDDCDFLELKQIDGLHLGQRDTPFSMIREAYPKKIIGLSTHNLEEALKAKGLEADYIGCGSMYPTLSKKHTTPLGIKGLKEIVDHVDTPKVAIGGINETNIQEVAETGCEMAAVISALVRNNKFVGQDLQELFLKQRD